MTITADLSNGPLLVNGAVFQVTCKVRSVGNGLRKRDEVVRSIPDNLPYDPMPFPKGLWNITGIEWQKDFRFDEKVYGPVKIRTDAWQWVNVWKLDKDGDYFEETGKRVKDFAYHLHYSTSSTTLGCIRLPNAKEATTIGKIIEQLFAQKEPVQLEVK